MSLGHVKCNIDTAFSSSNNHTRIDICIRDADGVFVLAKAVSFPNVYQVEVREAFGLFEALQWLSDMSFDNVDFEIESKVTCDAFHSRRENNFEFGHIITSCRSLFSAFFTTLGWNSQDDMQMRLLMHLHDILHFYLVPLLIFISQFVLHLLL